MIRHAYHQKMSQWNKNMKMMTCNLKEASYQVSYQNYRILDVNKQRFQVSINILCECCINRKFIHIYIIIYLGHIFINANSYLFYNYWYYYDVLNLNKNHSYLYISRVGGIFN